MKVLDLFAGIGGFTLGLERAGFETVAFCEIEPYAQKVLQKNWPEVPIYDDVRQLTAERLAADGIGVDVITGGFPCQDISLAGRQAGIEGERSGLWGEIARLISELQPRYAIMENVTNLISGDSGRWFGRVLGDLAEIGYDAEWHCIPASAIGAHHHRDRVWIICYPREVLLENSRHGRRWDTESATRGQDAQTERQCDTDQTIRPSEDVADTQCIGQSRQGMHGRSFSTKAHKDRQTDWLINRCEGNEASWDVEPDVGRVVDGIPNRSHRLKCLGNAVVPPIPELIGRAILEAN